MRDEYKVEQTPRHQTHPPLSNMQLFKSLDSFLVKANLFMENIINSCYSIKVSDSSHRSANFYNIYLCIILAVSLILGLQGNFKLIRNFPQ